MKQTECVAMLLAGGEGKRLGVLTTNIAKPAVHFGGKYRIIDFTLSNCVNSGIDTVGVLTQYQPMALNQHIGNGSPWDLNRPDGGVSLLAPYTDQKETRFYTGTANAVYQNLNYLEQYNPQYVLIISGDHIYNMDYRKMLDFHKSSKADATISVIEVKWEEASRFGILNTDGQHRVTEFVEKPAEPESNLASMGIYIFNWDVLKAFLLRDDNTPESSNDFGKNIIPAMIEHGAKLFAYPFQGYWKDVGTIDSLWEAHMDLLDTDNGFPLNHPDWPLYTNCQSPGPQFIAPTASIRQSMINDGCQVYGEVDRSVVFQGVEIGEGSIIRDSIIMPNVVIGKNVILSKAIIGEGTVIRDGAVVGDLEGKEITVIGEKEVVYKDTSDKMPKIFAGRNQRLLERIG
ncbi:glucose-1-phosphate adenylyltransferase [Paenibacillus aurantius]|uniref:Glucose-1-phosphate adenylyltransferase n=1 Tax=Paenibacillus aurantius TaxID=2918900 RepID=A0AA96LB24_9BACL|nr:glucose-1-phosphate adenylyltransferase [Paenibacillus aurantius]WNQ10539.1 glucose-1-phosphate adenylyltransferase [Paenibacillus aurantius]